MLLSGSGCVPSWVPTSSEMRESPPRKGYELMCVFVIWNVPTWAGKRTQRYLCIEAAIHDLHKRPSSGFGCWQPSVEGHVPWQVVMSSRNCGTLDWLPREGRTNPLVSLINPLSDTCIYRVSAIWPTYTWHLLDTLATTAGDFNPRCGPGVTSTS